MNRALRRRHRWMVPVVGLAGAVLLVTALRERARMGPPPMSDLSLLTRSAGPPAGALVLDQVFSPDSLLDIALWSGTEGSSRVFVGLRARGPLPYPSGQVYYRPPGVSAEEATLLGPVTGKRWAWYPLPDGPIEGGAVIIYSPGFGTATDSGSLPPPARAGGGHR